MDISADQLDYCDEQVIVEENSEFHLNSFNIEAEWKTDITPDAWVKSRQKFYNLLIDSIKQELI